MSDLQLYDIRVDEMREVTQEDLDRLVRQAAATAALLRALEHLRIATRQLTADMTIIVTPESLLQASVDVAYKAERYMPPKCD